MEQQHIDHVMLGRTLSASSDIESGSCTADGSDERLLPAERTVPARPSLLGDGATDELSSRQQRMDDRLRTLCLCVLALAVLAAGAFFLRSILIRFVLALALYYLLTPLIDALSCSWGSCRVPRGVATVAALGLAAGALLAVGVVVVRSITEFAAHASQYNNRIHQLSTVAFGGVQRLQDVLGTGAELPTDRAEASQLARAAVQKLDLAQILVKLMGSAAHVFENLIYILLFLAFMLAGRPAAQRAATPVERQIFSYIRGKVQWRSWFT
jgi:predicted PurR-regulated permease PerM